MTKQAETAAGEKRPMSCQYCRQFANDLCDVELRPDGLPWKYAYASRICGECRNHLNQTRQFRYKRGN